MTKKGYGVCSSPTELHQNLAPTLLCKLEKTMDPHELTFSDLKTVMTLSLQVVKGLDNKCKALAQGQTTYGTDITTILALFCQSSTAH